MNDSPLSIKDILGNKKKALIKPPAYQWQELALRIIKELRIPDFKRNSVFKVCRDKPYAVVMGAFNDTKELCTSGEQWRYFFKVIDGPGTPKPQD